MDHSVKGYLSRRSTQILEGLLVQYEDQLDEEYYADLYETIRTILAQRKETEKNLHNP